MTSNRADWRIIAAGIAAAVLGVTGLVVATSGSDGASARAELVAPVDDDEATAALADSPQTTVRVVEATTLSLIHI